MSSSSLTRAPQAPAQRRPEAPPPGVRRRSWASRRARLTPYVFLLPVIVLFIGFKIYPVLSALYLSFTQSVDGLTKFVGGANYGRILHDPLFWTALGNTVEILLIQVPIMLVLAILLAVAFNSKLLKARAFFRVAYFVPIVMGLVAYGILFSALLAQNGFVNFLLNEVGLPSVPWLADPFWAKISIVLAMTWHYTGQNSVMYLAQLQSIPEELFEAAQMDGANRRQQFWHVTLPGLRPAILLTVVLSTIGTLQLFDEPFVLTNGGPDNATLTIGMYLYQNAFRNFDFGYASAIGYVLAIIVAAISVAQMIVLRRRAQ
ncbi:carbohydrate ABC transporter permease [Frondihabitans australicus]|uniref:Carbohydrate ABC transporter membrane protein 1 (CUT1 family) n=1 Tax=Frondihabitans australicus TaxID=386892 RepID=A0A495IKZ9_9MICO|nr:sugar ABC transporter permease [Frondihabitans australicus]RKR76449.1 carbohydrate ABC transporter membrane protein 1 (CUT1 family) [Frondihabitans australicus]